MIWHYRLVFIGCFLNFSVVIGDIAEDYFFDKALRTTRQDCQKHLPDFLCNLKCYNNHFCLDGKCLCLDDIPHSSMVTRKENEEASEPDLTRVDSKDDLDRPVLRHHIAHFCPNLDKARDCIKTCMKVGKPAFCGKDHQCYCGHEYAGQGKPAKQDANEIYIEFRDMYEKYFGTTQPK